jgi:drug/metabolite transporter (DMT)-like permease
VANTVFLMNLSPVFVLLIAWLVYGERCSPAVLPAVPLALAGGALVAGGGAGGLSLPGGRDAWGITLALTSAVLYAVYLRLTKDLRSRLPTSLIMLGNSVVIAVMLAPLAFATSSPLLPHGAAGYLVILGYALVSQLLGHGLMAYALRGVSAGLASMSALLRPVVAVALAWLVLGETAGPLQLAGGLVLLAALAWFQLADRRPPVPDKVTGTVTGTVADRVADRVADKGD